MTDKNIRLPQSIVRVHDNWDDWRQLDSTSLGMNSNRCNQTYYFNKMLETVSLHHGFNGSIETTHCSFLFFHTATRTALSIFLLFSSRAIVSSRTKMKPKKDHLVGSGCGCGCGSRSACLIFAKGQLVDVRIGVQSKNTPWR